MLAMPTQPESDVPGLWDVWAALSCWKDQNVWERAQQIFLSVFCCFSCILSGQVLAPGLVSIIFLILGAAAGCAAPGNAPVCDPTFPRQARAPSPFVSCRFSAPCCGFLSQQQKAEIRVFGILLLLCFPGAAVTLEAAPMSFPWNVTQTLRTNCAGLVHLSMNPSAVQGVHKYLVRGSGQILEVNFNWKESETKQALHKQQFEMNHFLF